MTRTEAESFLISLYSGAIIVARRVLQEFGVLKWSANPAADLLAGSSPLVYLDVPVQDAANLIGVASLDEVDDGLQARTALRIAFIEAVLPDLRMGMFNQSTGGTSQSLGQVVDGLEKDLNRLKAEYAAVYPAAGASLTVSGARGGQLYPTPWAGRRPAGYGWPRSW
jgi:uncharacterized membrane protein